MRAKQTEHGTTVWLSAHDTYDWAHKPGAAWPCSTLSGKCLVVVFEANGDLVDVTVNGQGLSMMSDTDGHEFNACLSDHLRDQFGPDHSAIRDCPALT